MKKRSIEILTTGQTAWYITRGNNDGTWTIRSGIVTGVWYTNIHGTHVNDLEYGFDRDHTNKVYSSACFETEQEAKEAVRKDYEYAAALLLEKAKEQEPK